MLTFRWPCLYLCSGAIQLCAITPGLLGSSLERRASQASTYLSYMNSKSAMDRVRSCLKIIIIGQGYSSVSGALARLAQDPGFNPQNVKTPPSLKPPGGFQSGYGGGLNLFFVCLFVFPL